MPFDVYMNGEFVGTAMNKVTNLFHKHCWHDDEYAKLKDNPKCCDPDPEYSRKLMVHEHCCICKKVRWRKAIRRSLLDCSNAEQAKQLSQWYNSLPDYHDLIRGWGPYKNEPKRTDS
jgi:hypothetical protein